ncbi:adenylate/guanylate cyclase domain-containing protein [Prosthecobacter sp.]|uniref:adenylate/guanylate cyclase domain-containing protein n=1 Tax=Prosthecobacter sp. TaxID=1965333 RepID=UPI00378367A0
MQPLTSSAHEIAIHASQERLEKLLAERLTPGADRAAVDARIWNLFGETWAVMFTDLSGFSRNAAEFGIIHFLQVIYEAQRIFTPCVDKNDGILLKVEGDSMLIIFRTVANALQCALDMQRTAKEYNTGKPQEEHILQCIGLGYGPVLRIGDYDVFGREVNAASKLGEDTARAWEILVTASVQEAATAAEIPGLRFEPIADIPPGAKAAARVLYDL